MHQETLSDYKLLREILNESQPCCGKLKRIELKMVISNLTYDEKRIELIVEPRFKVYSPDVILRAEKRNVSAWNSEPRGISHTL